LRAAYPFEAPQVVNVSPSRLLEISIHRLNPRSKKPVIVGLLCVERRRRRVLRGFEESYEACGMEGWRNISSREGLVIRGERRYP
jgi:hypothetical protein